MDFALSEEQELLQQTLRGFIENECPPSVVRESFDAEAGPDPGLWKGLVELGIAGLLVPEERGGAGLGLLEAALAAEELGHGAVPAPFLGHALACVALVAGGSDAQKRRWLPALASGEAVASVALAEPSPEGSDAWDPAHWRCRIEDGRLRGRKAWVPQAAGADLLVVALAGGRLALAETGAGGVGIAPLDGVDRTRRLDAVDLDAAPAEPLEGDALPRVRDAGLVLLAADAFGAAYRLVRMSAEYAQSRQQFGQPIAQFQGLKHQLADMALDVDPTRSLWWYAAHAFDHLPAEAERAAALAKAHITDRAVQVARGAVRAHGGLGFTWECDVQIWFKRTLFDRAWLGTPEVHRERAAALGGW